MDYADDAIAGKLTYIQRENAMSTEEEEDEIIDEALEFIKFICEAFPEHFGRETTVQSPSSRHSGESFEDIQSSKEENTLIGQSNKYPGQTKRNTNLTETIVTEDVSQEKTLSEIPAQVFSNEHEYEDDPSYANFVSTCFNLN